MDNPEFLSLPLQSAHPSTVVPPPETIAVTEVTSSPGTMNQVPSFVPTSQGPPTQPITSSSPMLDAASSTAVTSVESMQTQSPSLLEKGIILENSVRNGSVVGRNKGSSAHSGYSRSSRIPLSSRRGRSDGTQKIQSF